MKKTLSLLLVCLLSTITITAQKEKVYVYGVDFSQVKTYAADESLEQFAAAFKGINMLLMTEYEKYDFSKMLNTRFDIDLETMLKKMDDCSFVDMKVWGTSYEELDYNSMVSEYDFKQSEGIGVVLIAKFLNKATAEATYELVLFDIATREILSQKTVVGKARGFGLRNFWAGSVYNVLQTTRISLPD